MPSTNTTTRRLEKLTPDFVRGWFESLMEAQEGCCHLEYAADEKYAYSVCMGWTQGFADKQGQFDVAWKIGRQTHNNIMQCDLDIDFEMPWDEKTGDVDNTLTRVCGSSNWEHEAFEMREEARRIWERYRIPGEERLV